MAEALYVLYETGSGEDDLEGLHEALANEWLFNEYKDEFSYFTTEWDESNKEDSFFGKDDPEKMRGYANGWNDRLNQTLRYAEEAVRKDMETKGYDDFVNYIADNRAGILMRLMRDDAGEHMADGAHVGNIARVAGKLCDERRIL